MSESVVVVLDAKHETAVEKKKKVMGISKKKKLPPLPKHMSKQP